MIINGFGGGAAQSLGLTILRPGQTLWNAGTADGCTLNTNQVDVTTYTNWKSTSVINPKLSSDQENYYNCTLFNNCFWFGGVVGKTLSIDYCAKQYGSNYSMTLGIAPNIVVARGMSTSDSWVNLGFIARQVVSTNAANTTITISLTIPNYAVMGYIQIYSRTNTTNYYYFDNICISS